jgi:hypothetical protein
MNNALEKFQGTTHLFLIKRRRNEKDHCFFDIDFCNAFGGVWAEDAQWSSHHQLLVMGT